MTWAMIIHKGQGLTLDKAVLKLGEKDFAPGLSFVGISQVKTLNGLAFWTRFEVSHLQKPKETDSMKMLREENENLGQLGLHLNTYDVDLSEYVDAHQQTQSGLYSANTVLYRDP